VRYIAYSRSEYPLIKYIRAYIRETKRSSNITPIQYSNYEKKPHARNFEEKKMEMKTALLTNENPDLKKERQSCSFNKEELTNLIDGGPNQTNDRRQLGIMLSYLLM